MGGSSLVATSLNPVVKICLQQLGDKIYGKLSHGGGPTFEVEGFLKGDYKAWSNGPPSLDGDLIHLASDSKTFGSGAKPFAPDANIIAVELLQSPEQQP